MFQKLVLYYIQYINHWKQELFPRICVYWFLPKSHKHTYEFCKLFTLGSLKIFFQTKMIGSRITTLTLGCFTLWLRWERRVPSILIPLVLPRGFPILWNMNFPKCCGSIIPLLISSKLIIKRSLLTHPFLLFFVLIIWISFHFSVTFSRDVKDQKLKRVQANMFYYP